MNLRPVKPGDRAALRDFRCSDGTPPQNEVEDWIRKQSAGWCNASVNNELWVLISDADELIGFFAIMPGEDDGETFIAAIAIASSAPHNEGIATRILGGCLNRIAQLHDEPIAVWNVDKRNTYALKMSMSSGARPDPAPKFAKVEQFYLYLY